MQNNKLFRHQAVIVLSAYGFLVIAVGVLFCLYFAPEYLNTFSIPAVANYYSIVTPHLVQDLSRVSLHIAGGCLLLSMMLFQINDRLHRQFPLLHRYVGATYFSVGAVVAGSGFLLSENIIGGAIARAATCIFTAFWFFAAYKSLYHVWRKEIRLHKRWTAASCFTTLATGFIRPIGIVLGLIFPKQAADILFAAANWLAIAATLALCWWYIKKIESRPKEISQPKRLSRFS